jgi:toxin ParE1/3/4
MRLILSPRAKADIDDIWNYSFERWDLVQANIYVNQQRATTNTISVNPKLGVQYDECRKGYRKYNYRSHIIFFKVSSNALTIIRILHQKMDFIRQL